LFAGPRTRLIGIGNRFRSDDSIVPRVVDELKSHGDNLDIIEYGGDGATLIDLWDGFDRIVIVDATRSGAPPGTIHRLDAIAQEIPSTFFNYSTHAFSVAEAIEVARRIDRLPREMLLVGIEGENFDAGLELSPPVARALPIVLAEITAQIPGCAYEPADN
jgi:hydrogenase maturation protease